MQQAMIRPRVAVTTATKNHVLMHHAMQIHVLYRRTVHRRAPGPALRDRQATVHSATDHRALRGTVPWEIVHRAPPGIDHLPTDHRAPQGTGRSVTARHAQQGIVPPAIGNLSATDPIPHALRVNDLP